MTKKYISPDVLFLMLDMSSSILLAVGLYLVEYVLRLPLQEGNYALRALITSPVVHDETSVFLDVIDDAVVFQIARWKVARVWSKIHLFPTVHLRRLG